MLINKLLIALSTVLIIGIGFIFYFFNIGFKNKIEDFKDENFYEVNKPEILLKEDLDHA